MRRGLFIAAILFLFAVSAHAQVSQVQFVVTPEVPGPNQKVIIEAQGVGGVLGGATISWSLNGQTVLSGVGERMYSFTTGGVGSQTRVRATVTSSSLGTVTQDFTFTPSNVWLLWESNTSAPPFYRGKSLYSAGSQIKVIALPQVVSGGSTISSNRLSYEWSVNSNPATQQSGLGRNVLTFAGDQLKQGEQVSVNVYSGSAVVGSGNVFIPATNPELLVYIQDPLRGTLYDQALPSVVSLAGKEVSLKAEPYYFSRESLNTSTSYTWILNGEEVTGPDSSRGILTLRQTGAGAGEGSLIIQLQNNNTTQLLQAASTRIRLLFGI